MDRARSDQGVVEGALEALDAHATHPESVPLFDALFYLRDALAEGDEAEARAQIATLRRQLERSQHPLRASIAATLDGFERTAVEVARAPADTPVAVLEAMGVPIYDGDVPESMRRFVRREREQRRALQDRARWLESRYAQAVRTANVLSVVSTVLGGLVVVVLLVAMGVVEVEWMEPGSMEEGAGGAISAPGTSRARQNR